MIYNHYIEKQTKSIECAPGSDGTLLRYRSLWNRASSFHYTQLKPYTRGAR